MPLSRHRARTRFNEAEAHAPRIHPLTIRIDPDLSQASMRPRRMRLGYRRGLLSGSDWHGRGFNEAEAHAPRIPRQTPRQRRARRRRFNEAEAHAPRIPPAVLDQVNILLGFNEAEAHAPRIHLDVAFLLFFCLAGFNEAEAHAPRIHHNSLYYSLDMLRLQ